MEGRGGEELARWERWEGMERGCSAVLAGWERSEGSEAVNCERREEGDSEEFGGGGKGASAVTWQIGKGGGTRARR